MDFSFVTSNNLDMVAGTSKILNIADRFYGEDETRIRGQLLTLFGEPMYTTSNFESAYFYVIIATDSNGKQTVLTVYCGRTGAAIGGNTKIQNIDKIAAELKKYIKQADTTDFQYVGYYPNGPTKIQQKIENGNIYFSESKIEEYELEKLNIQ